MTFDDYMQQIRTCDTAGVSPDWGQGRTTFGGLTTAMALTRARLQAGQQPLRSAAVSFCAPLMTADPFSFSEQVLQSGRSVTHIESNVRQKDQLAIRIQACYGQQRESSVAVSQPAGIHGEPGAGRLLPFIPGITPDFTQHVELAFVAGGLPFSNSSDNHLQGWMRFRDGNGPLTSAHAVALTDAWPPTPLQKLSTPSPCATVTWNLEMVTPPEQLSAPLRSTDWLWYEAEIRHAHDGYGHTEARVFSPDGTLLLLSRQLVVIYG